MPRRERGPVDPERLINEASSALRDGDARSAFELAERACRIAPLFAPAIHVQAAALEALGRTDEARSAYERALSLDGRNLDILMDALEFYVTSLDEDPNAFERICRLAPIASEIARESNDEEAIAEVAIAEAEALACVGRPADALACLDAALKRCRDDTELLAERGLVLYELGRFEEAREQLLSAVTRDADHALAQQTLGLIAERSGEAEEARARFAAARRLAPEDFPEPLGLSPDEFDAVVEDALARLPPPVRAYLSNVAIAVEDLPPTEDLLSDPPLSPSILGMFRGSSLRDKASMDPWSHFPSSIVLYQKNIERSARDRAGVVEEIRITLLHEVGHFLGLDEHDLWERGLD